MALKHARNARIKEKLSFFNYNHNKNTEMFPSLASLYPKV